MSLSRSAAPTFEYTFIKRAHALFTSAVTLGAALLFLIPDFPIPAGFLGVCIASCLFHVVLFLAFDRATPRAFTAANILNLLMLVAAVHYTGGILSPFTMVFALVLISGAGYGVNMPAALGVSVGAYAGLILAEKTGVLPPVELTPTGIYQSWPATLFVLLSVIAFMVSSGSIYRETVNMLRKKIGLELEIKQSMANRLARLDAPSQVGLLVNKIVQDVHKPLNTVTGFLQVFRADAALSQEVREDCNLMLQELGRVGGMIDRMFAYVRIEDAGRERLCPRDVLETVLSVVSFLNGAAGITVVKNLPPPGAMYIYANKQELHQVFFNLLKNAIEACPAGWPDREIRVSVTRDERHAVISIADTGCGVPREILSSLGSEVVSTKPRAGGIGLIVASEIIRSYKGKLTFKSTPGSGTTAVVSLPVYQPAERDERQEIHAPASQT